MCSLSSRPGFLGAVGLGFATGNSVGLYSGAVAVSGGGGAVVLEHLSGLLSREPPVDLRPALVGPTIPSLGLPLQLSQIRKSGVYPDIDASTG